MQYPFVLGILFGLAWLALEFTEKRILRILVGLFTIIMVLALTGMASRLGMRFANLETRGCVCSIREAMDTKDLANVKQCLDNYSRETSKNTGYSEAAHKLMKCLKELPAGAIAPGAPQSGSEGRT